MMEPVILGPSVYVVYSWSNAEGVPELLRAFATMREAQDYLTDCWTRNPDARGNLDWEAVPFGPRPD